MINPSMFCSGGWDNLICVWKLENEKNPIFQLTGHSKRVDSLLTLNRHVFCSGSADGSIRIWRFTKSYRLCSLDHFVDIGGRIGCLAKINENTIAGGNDNSNLYILRKTSSSGHFKVVKTLTRHTQTVECLTVLNEKVIFSGSYDNSIIMWNIENGTVIKIFEGHVKMVDSLCVLAPNILASACRDNSIGIWNIKTGKSLGEITGQKDASYCLTKMKNFLVSGSADKNIYFWKIILKTKKEIFNLEEKKLYTDVKEDDEIIKMEWECVKQFDAHGEVYSVLALPNHNLISTFFDSKIFVWGTKVLFDDFKQFWKKLNETQRKTKFVDIRIICGVESIC